MAGAATGTAVALTIGKGILVPEVILEFSYIPLIAALAAVIIWTTLATRHGLPVSSTHCLDDYSILGMPAQRPDQNAGYF